MTHFTSEDTELSEAAQGSSWTGEVLGSERRWSDGRATLYII